MRNSKVPDVAAMKLILITLVALVMGTIVACAGGAVEVNTVPTATTTPGVNPANRPVVIPTNRPVVIPTNRPVVIPTNRPVVIPTNRPIAIPTNRPIAIPTNRPIAIPTGPSSNSTRPGVAGQIDPCNCHGYAGFGGPCYDGFGGPAYAGFGGPAYAGFGGPCYDEAAVVNYGQEFFRTRKVSQDTFDAALAQFGVLGLTELTNLMGCYSMLAFNVNAFGVELPEDSPEKPLPV